MGIERDFMHDRRIEILREYLLGIRCDIMNLISKMPEESQGFYLEKSDALLGAVDSLEEEMFRLKVKDDNQKSRLRQLEKSILAYRSNKIRGWSHEPDEIKSKIIKLEQGNQRLALSLKSAEQIIKDIASLPCVSPNKEYNPDPNGSMFVYVPCGHCGSCIARTFKGNTDG